MEEFSSSIDSVTYIENIHKFFSANILGERLLRVA